LLSLMIISSGCRKTTEKEPDPYIPPPDNTVLNEPGPPPEPQTGDFTIVVLPDTQYYLCFKNGGKPEMFKSQIDWIQENQAAENIVYVAHVGDIVENGDNPNYANSEWSYAKDIMYGLENPVSIPYGIAVGNHDQTPFGNAIYGTTTNYNKYFGVKHFEGRPYYGGNYGINNDSHYDLFTAGGFNFIVVYIEYDGFDQNWEDLNNWAYDVLSQHSSRKGIIVSHYIMGNNSITGSNEGTPGTLRPQGQAIYDRVKSLPNVFMMLCGHILGNGEGYREDTYKGNTIRTFLSNYQGRENGGNGRMRLYRFLVNENKLAIKTYSPYTNEYETDGDSQFTVNDIFN